MEVTPVWGGVFGEVWGLQCDTEQETWQEDPLF